MKITCESGKKNLKKHCQLFKKFDVPMRFYYNQCIERLYDALLKHPMPSKMYSILPSNAVMVLFCFMDA